MRWFLVLLIIQATAFAMVTPNWMPRSHNELAQSSFYAPTNLARPVNPFMPMTTLASQLPQTFPVWTPQAMMRPQQGYTPYFPGAWNSQYFGNQQYFGSSGYNFGIPPYYGFQNQQQNFTGYNRFAQNPFLQSGYNPYMQSLNSGYNQQNWFSAPTGPTWMDYVSRANLSAPVDSTPVPTYASTSTYRTHSDFCETCHTSRRLPVASPIATGSYVAAPEPDHVTEARHASPAVGSAVQPTYIAQTSVDRVAIPEVEASAAYKAPAAKVVPQPSRVAGTTPQAKPDPHAGHNHDDDNADDDDKSIPPPRNAPPPPSPQRTVLTPRSSQERDSQKQPVWASFADEFSACAPAGCEPYNYHAKSNRGGNSCHDVGRAIDVHAMMCPAKQNGKDMMVVERAISSRKFADMVKCVQSRRKIKVLWQNKPYSSGTITSGHYDHAHFSIGCRNGTYW